MTLFDPPVMRFTVRTPQTRHDAIKRHAARVGMTPQQLVQALFDCLDLSAADGAVKMAKDKLERLFPKAESTTELARRAASVGLTVKELKVFRALAAAAGEIGVVTPSPIDIEARSGVAACYFDEAFDRLTQSGFIAPQAAYRGRRSYAIRRMPGL